MSGDPVDQAAVDALLRERSGYATRGLWNRVAQVDAQLLKLGVDVESAVASHVVDESASPTSASEAAEVTPVAPVVEEAGGSSVRRKSGRRAG